MELGWVLSFVFVIVTVLFVIFAVFLPEWVGIQGKKAKSIQKSHHDESSQSAATADDLNKK